MPPIALQDERRRKETFKSIFNAIPQGTFFGETNTIKLPVSPFRGIGGRQHTKDNLHIFLGARNINYEHKELEKTVEILKKSLSIYDKDDYRTIKIYSTETIDIKEKINELSDDQVENYYCIPLLKNKIMTSVDFINSKEIYSFTTDNNLIEEIDKVIDIFLEKFKKLTNVKFKIDYDPEYMDQWLNIELSVMGSVEENLKYYNNFIKDFSSLIDISKQGLIKLFVKFD